MKKILLISVLSLTAAVMSGADLKEECINFKSSRKTVLHVSVDGQPVKVGWYVDNYVKYPNRQSVRKNMRGEGLKICKAVPNRFSQAKT